MIICPNMNSPIGFPLLLSTCAHVTHMHNTENGHAHIDQERERESACVCVCD
jgi:hypothetical protein